MTVDKVYVGPNNIPSSLRRTCSITLSVPDTYLTFQHRDSHGTVEGPHQRCRTGSCPVFVRSWWSPEIDRGPVEQRSFAQVTCLTMYGHYWPSRPILRSSNMYADVALLGLIGLLGLRQVVCRASQRWLRSGQPYPLTLRVSGYP